MQPEGNRHIAKNMRETREHCKQTQVMKLIQMFEFEEKNRSSNSNRKCSCKMVYLKILTLYKMTKMGSTL